MFLLNSTLFRQLAVVIALAVTTNPLYALGLGQLEVASALGQPLAATVQLVDSQGFSVTEIVAEIADTEAYERMGIDKPFFHENLQIVTRVKNKHLFLTLRSNKPVKEPFLNIVLSLRWPSGNVLKEYTVLLDLPAAVSKDIITTKETADSEAVTVETTQTPAASTHTKTAAMPAASDRYVVQSGDSLWSIAKDLQRNTKAPIAKIMQAIFVQNPDAFLRRDPGRLKPAHSLLIPSTSDIDAAANAMPVRKGNDKVVAPRETKKVYDVPVIEHAITMKQVAPVETYTQEVSAPQTVNNPAEKQVLDDKNTALRTRIVELELASAQLKERLQQMNERAALLTDEMNAYELESIAAPVAITPPVETVIDDKPYPAVSRQENANAAGPIALAFAWIKQNWLIVLSGMALLMTMSLWLMLLRKIKNNKKDHIMAAEKKPFWEMPAQDFSHAHVQSSNKTSFNRPDQAYSEVNRLSSVN